MVYIGSEVSSDIELLRNAKKDLMWIDANYSELLKKNENSFVAVKNGEYIASAKDLGSLLASLKAKGIDPVETTIKYITNAITIL